VEEHVDELYDEVEIPGVLPSQTLRQKDGEELSLQRNPGVYDRYLQSPRIQSTEETEDNGQIQEPSRARGQMQGRSSFLYAQPSAERRTVEMIKLPR
jgi:hypothetical protein